MALAIVWFHMLSWNMSILTSSNVITRLGIYGVSIFFVLSGLSMAYSYEDYFKDFKMSIPFLIRRVFRVWPLLWICIALVVIPNMIYSEKSYGISQIILNATTSFGCIQSIKIINTGAWSIGSEAVYYLLTPFLLMMYKKNKYYGHGLVVVSVGIALVFAFFLINPSMTLENQWNTYINPLNNLALYSAGISIYYIFKQKKISKKINLTLLFISLVIFIFYPVEGGAVNLVTGVPRVIFCIVSISIVTSFYNLNFDNKSDSLIQAGLRKIGEISYGIYLLHPVIYWYINFLLKEYFMLIIALTISITLILSYSIYHFVEKKMNQIGRVLANQLENHMANRRITQKLLQSTQ